VSHRKLTKRRCHSLQLASEAKASDRQDDVSRARASSQNFHYSFRPEGPVLKARVREGVAESLHAEERRRCGTVLEIVEKG
jgi:hypothetical protein